VRGWLSPSEVAALRVYSAEVPAFPSSEAFHTYERNGEGAVVPSRTEHFAHIEDAGGVGAFLREGRLRELCSALREGRPFELYKGVCPPCPVMHDFLPLSHANTTRTPSYHPLPVRAEKINYKLKGKTGGYKPHVDFYSKINSETLEREFLLDDSDVCVCMVAIDDMDEGNGCPFVAPGQHTRGPLFFKGAVESLTYGDKASMAGAPLIDPDDLQWFPVTLAAGDVLIYGNNMPHYSKENTSERDRRALFAVYTDARHGNLRGPYYRAEAEGRRKAGSEREGGKANGFFTGQAVLQQQREASAVRVV